MKDNLRLVGVYEWHKNSSCCTWNAICSICGEPVRGAHYWRPKAGKSCYYHAGTCITAAKLGAEDEYGEWVKQQKLDVNGY